MVERRDIGGWLGSVRVEPSSGADTSYPGQRLGLARHGPRSVARVGPRAVAFGIDTVLCNLVAAGAGRWAVSVPHGTLVLWIFLLEVFLLTCLGGASAGHRVVGLQVVRLDGTPPTPLAALIRTVGLGLGFPALVWDRDQRGLHDKAAGTVLVRTR